MPSFARLSEDFDLRNTWQIAIGAILMPLGLGVILLGWQGASHARVVQQQIPYLVSGSFIGLGLMIAGGLMFWAHWLYRIYDQNDLHHQQLLEAISQLAGGSANGQAAASPVAGQRLVATATGTNFHRPDCSVVKGRRGLRSISESDAARMQPCRICEPLVQR
ncbi:MAG TPA: hypothetical protein VFB78_10375 [Acidimicrobiales bacterium]|nr:hypothetical protein [Acidimicrobiales bacterium]